MNITSIIKAYRLKLLTFIIQMKPSIENLPVLCTCYRLINEATNFAKSRGGGCNDAKVVDVRRTKMR